jgi:hypothetical protein
MSLTGSCGLKYKGDITDNIDGAAAQTFMCERGSVESCAAELACVPLRSEGAITIAVLCVCARVCERV